MVADRVWIVTELMATIFTIFLWLLFSFWMWSDLCTTFNLSLNIDLTGLDKLHRKKLRFLFSLLQVSSPRMVLWSRQNEKNHQIQLRCVVYARSRICRATIYGIYSKRALYVVFQISASVTALWKRWKIHNGSVTRLINAQAI